MACIRCQTGRKSSPPRTKATRRVQLLGSGTILREVIAGAELLAQDFGVGADIWSVTSFTELRREAMRSSAGTCCIRPSSRGRATSRPASPAAPGRSSQRPTTCELFAEQIRSFVPSRYRVLGTDGFGRSDYRKKLRDFFEVDRRWVAVAALKALAEEGQVNLRSSPMPSRVTNFAA